MCIFLYFSSTAGVKRMCRGHDGLYSNPIQPQLAVVAAGADFLSRGGGDGV